MANEKHSDHIHSQSTYKPNLLTGIKIAKVGAALGTRFGPQGVVIGGAVGFVTGALVGGMLDESLSEII